MNEHFGSQPARVSIAAAERDTGLSKETLRVWERRYGFPRPERDRVGERAYPADQVEKLRVVKRLMERGHRPGRIVGRPLDELQGLLGPAPGGEPLRQAQVSAELRTCLTLLRAHDVEGLRHGLAHALTRLGLGRFVLEVVVPLHTQVSDAWMRGELEVFEERLAIEMLMGVLRAAVQGLPRAMPAQRPCVLLTSFPGEPYGLALLMAEALFVLEGARCISLGPQTPVWDIARAASACAADIVGVAFAGSLGPNQVVDGLTELRRKLPASIEVWAGGSAPVLRRRPVEGVRAVIGLQRLPEDVAEWRLRTAAATPA